MTGPGRRRLIRSFVLAAILLSAPDIPARAAEGPPPKINVYRFLLGADVPESPGIMVLDRQGPRVVRGSAPKPVALSVINETSRSSNRLKLGLDFVPYHFAGGGTRSLSSYRSNSLGGRLTRVLTKTSLSLAARPDPEASGGTRIGLALRATFHDPRDPVLNSALPESVESVLRRGKAGEIGPTDEDVTDRGIDIGPALAAARRLMRQRPGVQVSGGYGQSLLLRQGSVRSDSVTTREHVYWLAAQVTLSGRFDLLLTAQLRNPPGDGSRTWLGAGLLRKMDPVDVSLELAYDTEERRAFPGLKAEIRPLSRLQVVGSFSTGPEAGLSDTRTFTALAGVRWLAAHDPS